MNLISEQLIAFVTFNTVIVQDITAKDKYQIMAGIFICNKYMQ